MTDTPDTSRRHVIKGLGALGVAPGLAALATQNVGTAEAAPAAALPHVLPPMPPAEFLPVSSLITGLTLDNSYIELSEKIWAALATTSKRDSRLRALVTVASTAGNDWQQAIRTANLLPLAQEVALIWYTGAVNFNANTGGEQVLTYDSALAWRACSFTKPPANCGGPFGYWYDPA